MISPILDRLIWETIKLDRLKWEFQLIDDGSLAASSQSLWIPRDFQNKYESTNTKLMRILETAVVVMTILLSSFAMQHLTYNLLLRLMFWSLWPLTFLRGLSPVFPRKKIIALYNFAVLIFYFHSCNLLDYAYWLFHINASTIRLEWIF